MKRREFMTLLAGAGAAAACAFAARSQPVDRIRRVGMLIGMPNDADGQIRIKKFHQRLGELGWIEGQALRTDVRWVLDDPDRLRTCTHELVDAAPDVLVAASLPATAALHEATGSIPIIFLVVPDPVGNGFVANLTRPEHNLTGFTNFDSSMGSKWLEILKEIAPRTARVGLLWDPELFSHGRRYFPSIAAAAASFGVELANLAVHDAPDIERVLGDFACKPDSGLVVLPDNTLVRHREVIVSAAARRGLPAVYPYRYFTTCGGLVSYGMDTVDLYARAAQYVDRILRGARPAELPVQHPSKFELVVNLAAAKALGIDVPLTTVARADEVIG
jgi:putative ABC transport system substrate-binding protein